MARILSEQTLNGDAAKSACPASSTARNVTLPAVRLPPPAVLTVPSDAPTMLDNPGDVFEGSEFLMEDVLELGNPTLATHEVTHRI